MKTLFYVCLVVSLVSCGPRIYSYKFSMSESKKPRKLLYGNDTVSIVFDFYYKGIMIGLTNTSEQVIRINWDELKLMENDTTKNIMHTLLNEEREFYMFKPPASIAPKGSVSDLIVYADHVSYSTEDDRDVMNIEDMYPRESKNRDRASIEKLIGKRATLIIPLEYNNMTRVMNFHFVLRDIKSRRAFTVADAILLIPIYSFE